MRGKRLKWILAVLPLIVSLSIVNAAGATLLYGEAVIDDSLQAPSTFTVDLNVTDVVDLSAWQVKMYYDTTVLDFVSVSEGDFLKGNPAATWEPPVGGRPYAHETTPYSEQERAATASTTSVAGWTPDPFFYTIPQVLEDTLDGSRAVSETDGAEEILGTFGFTTPAFVATLEVGIQGFNIGNLTEGERDLVDIEVSNDGGGTWGPTHEIMLPETAPPVHAPYWEDITGDFAWTPSMLSDANFKVKMRYHQVGATANTTKVDYLGVRLTDTLVIDSPVRSYDNNVDTYADFAYSDVDGTFTVLEFGHNFPSGVLYPADEHAAILQVDLYLRYAADASASSDKYKISYYVPRYVPDETVLEPWTSSSTTLGTYTYTDIADPDAFEPDWDWVDLSYLEITVATDRVGGDANARFYLYEAWLVVTYERPTSFAHSADDPSGELLVSGITSGTYAGVSGSGRLATVTFQATAYGYTLLNITDTERTWLKDSDLDFIPFTFEDGYFRNLYPGDVDADKYVGSVDASILNGAYGKSRGDSGYVREADFDDDGYIGSVDASILNGAYGTTYP
jgi:hypothetical protein